MPDFRLIPSIEQLRQRAVVRALEARFGAAATVTALREAATAARGAIAGGDTTLSDEHAVAVKDGKVSFTARGLKGAGDDD